MRVMARSALPNPRERAFSGAGSPGDAVDAVDRDQVTFDQLHHAVRADAQPVILAAVERLTRIRVSGQRGHRRVDRSHAVLVVHVAARRRPGRR